MDYLRNKLPYLRFLTLVNDKVYPYYKAIQKVIGNNVKINNREILMFGSNSYLGLEQDERVKKATIDAIGRFGTGTGGSRFLNGTLAIHEELEHNIADFLGKEAAVTFGTGFSVNSGVIPAIASRKDFIYSDKLNHASILEGCAISLAKTYKYKHNNFEDLDTKITKFSNPEGQNIIVSDGIFSMEGDIVNLPEMVKVAHKHNAKIMLDCAHAIGVIGKKGAGTASHFNLTDAVDLIGGTFSKSLASQGGFIAGSRLAIDYLKHAVRPIMFSASMTPANTAAALTALNIIREDDSLRQKLQDNSLYLRQLLRASGFQNIYENPTPIIPLKIGSSQETFLVTKQLFELGVFVNPIVHPAVPEGECILRISTTANHTRKHLEYFVEMLFGTMKNLSII